jgi:L-ascorbate metabolism protein UlaG (beta-lactamase superfamily)
MTSALTERLRSSPARRSRVTPNETTGRMRVTQIGHSTVLVEAAGTRLILDPYFGRRGNPAYRRRAPPARSREACLDVDAVLISHAHRSRAIIPIHLGLEPRLAALRRAEGAESFRKLARRERLAADLVALEPGESYSW